MPNDISGMDQYEQKLIRNFLSTTAALYYRFRSFNIRHTEADQWMDAVNTLMQQVESNTEDYDYDDNGFIIINPEQPYGSSLWGLLMEGWHHGRQGCGLTFCGCSNGEIARDEHGMEIPKTEEATNDSGPAENSE